MRLSPEQIREIITAHNNGLPNSAIARHHQVDVSTVRYHIEKTETTYGTTRIYTVMTPRKKACDHPSLKCLLCGQAQDHIHRRELETISLLQQKLDKANKLLERYGIIVD